MQFSSVLQLGNEGKHGKVLSRSFVFSSTSSPNETDEDDDVVLVVIHTYSSGRRSIWIIAIGAPFQEKCKKGMAKDVERLSSTTQFSLGFRSSTFVNCATCFVYKFAIRFLFTEATALAANGITLINTIRGARNFPNEEPNRYTFFRNLRVTFFSVLLFQETDGVSSSVESLLVNIFIEDLELLDDPPLGPVHHLRLSPSV